MSEGELETSDSHAGLVLTYVLNFHVLCKKFRVVKFNKYNKTCKNFTYLFLRWEKIENFLLALGG